MRRVLLTLSLLTMLQADSILMPIGSIHNKTSDKHGQRYNNVNTGLGVELDVYERGNHSITFNTMALNDSYEHLMLSASFEYSYSVLNSLNLCLDFGIVSKELKDSSTTFKRRFLPAPFVPSITYKLTDKLSVKILHVPQLTYNDIYIDGVSTLILIHKF